MTFGPITRRSTLLALPALAAPAVLRAQPAYPNRPIRMVVPFPAGGATDLTARVVAERMGALLGQPVVIDNRPGAGGNLGSDMVAKAEPDGYTLLTFTIGTASINQFLYTRLPYDPAKDLASVALINEVANGICVSADSPFKTLQDLLAAAKAKPGELNFGTPGNGTSGHLCGEYLKTKTGVNLTHVPYRGTSQVIPDVLGGRVEVAIDNLPGYLPHLQAGRMRCLAVTSANRWFSLPDVPTVKEAGVPDFEAVAWFGFQAPARVPRPIIDKLAETVAKIVAEPATVTKLREIGSDPKVLAPAELDRYIAAENAKWREVVKASGARLD
ncbi:Bug family tripartite tricarboxylate transporter substrate binding protein [Roseomonas xinghualingensis]|uniref:Bug family tripartite tricarboxylate transporter substrate binding protein n=1 Tax=Roseomonas xinghualingensis TaxID=2986475 RepID=UPI0021F22840|nr:tripartite tricarboxylate transporter substrate binding protein [Roseomonas sp. SXEYE001]MCV4208010.1 tripartite tricarboxylate transporter substrate binding protein [Roseomonas sp. SXEYE001]